ncbi:MAG TPA: lipopolysaccharide kinase InaA family protein [Candidatus Binatus sp.]|nr:lipopolysaccharide kinase InaA family protein [Candidatus Binatus sp.]
MFTETLTWGTLPAGFVKRTDSQGYRWVLRQDRAHEIDFSTDLDERSGLESSRYSGRARLSALRLSDGETALIRPYRHGGFFRAYTGAWFFTWPPRPFRELVITEELRRRGLPTVEVYAACVSCSVLPFYRGWLVVRELSDSEDLWSALQSGFLQRVGFQAALRAVAQSLRAMHREGVYHSDLNLKNILVRAEADRVVSYLIDFDKARLFLGKLPAELVKRNLDRLLRSALKLDPERKFFPASAWEEFLGFYHEAANG